MTSTSATLHSIALLAGLLAAGCSTSSTPAPATPSPAAAGAPHAGHPAPMPEPSGEPHAARVDPDVAFMSGMIVHHRQALEMTALVPERTENRAVRLLSERIEVSQRDEIARMVGWLEDRGYAPGAHHPPDERHPGILTDEQMSRLAAASGDAFDRIFLDSMIQHHEGALVMVEELFATPGAGQDPQVFQLASEVESDQRMEIERMYRVRASLES